VSFAISVPMLDLRYCWRRNLRLGRRKRSFNAASHNSGAIKSNSALYRYLDLTLIYLNKIFLLNFRVAG
jgi:hypothetical protein